MASSRLYKIAHPGHDGGYSGDLTRTGASFVIVRGFVFPLYVPRRRDLKNDGADHMKKLSVLGIIGGAALLTAAPYSLQWSQKNVALSLDSAEARIGRPGTALSVAGVTEGHIAAQFAGRSTGRAPQPLLVTVLAGTTAATAIRRIPHRPSPSYGTGYGYGSYYGGYGYPGYSTAPYNPGPSFGFGWRY